MYAWNLLRRLAQVAIVASALLSATHLAASDQAPFAEPSVSSVDGSRHSVRYR